MINLDPTIGAEIKKTRPAIIVSDDALGKLPLKNHCAHYRLERYLSSGTMDDQN